MMIWVCPDCKESNHEDYSEPNFLCKCMRDNAHNSGSPRVGLTTEHDVVCLIQNAMEAAAKHVYGFDVTAIPAVAWKTCQDAMEAAIASFTVRLNDPAVLQVVAEHESKD
jgi:hypothetical protein